MKRSVIKRVLVIAGVVITVVGIIVWASHLPHLGCYLAGGGSICLAAGMIMYHVYVGGGVALALAFFFGFLLGEWTAAPYETIVPQEYLQEYCLLTWKSWSGDICFELMPRTDRDRFLGDWTGKWRAQCGIPNLEKALAHVPKDMMVGWQNRPSRFTYPDQKVVRQVLDFANSKGIRIELEPTLDAPLFPEAKGDGQ